MVCVIANVTRSKIYTDSTQHTVTFESLQPFLAAGISSKQLLNKTWRGKDNTLFVNTHHEYDIIGLGPAMFDISDDAYPTIYFIEMLSDEKYENQKRLNRMEESLELLTKLVRKLLVHNNIEESESDTD